MDTPLSQQMYAELQRHERETTGVSQADGRIHLRKTALSSKALI